MGGLVLDAAVGVFNGFVVFQPIINGIGGNLVSVQASKISTMLHQSSIIGIVPPHTAICESPWRALANGGKRDHHENSFDGKLTTTFCSLIFSSICQNSSNFDFDVDPWSNSVHFPGRLYPHVHINHWFAIHFVILVREFATGMN